MQNLEPGHENELPRDRLSLLSQASLRINESLDFDSVLQQVVDSARELTGARYAGMSILDVSGGLERFVTSGFSPEELERFLSLSDGPVLFAHFSALPAPLRIADFHALAASFGFPDLDLPMRISSALSFLAAPILYGGGSIGNIYLAEKEAADEFSLEDEHTLVMFASQAALVIANARRHREEQRARADLETLVNTSPVGVVVFDAKSGVPVKDNLEARRIMEFLRMPGRSLDELLEVLTFRRADGRELSLAESPLALALSTAETVRAEEIVIEVPDGRSLRVLVNATPIISQDGTIQSMVVTIQDMSPLEELELLRAEFLGMVSHELRTPLTTIRGSAMTLLGEAEDLDPAEAKQFHRIILDQAEHMRDLIGDLLDVTRIETGTLSVDPEPVSVQALVDEARSRFASASGQHDVVMEISSGLPPVMADRRRIVQVLGNLLSNAARHSPRSVPLTVRAVMDGSNIAFSVADEGRGVPPDRLPHLFRKFFIMNAGNASESGRDTGGAGLGLAICRGIVEAHGGRIWAHSPGSGLGSVFTFTLPSAELDVAGAAPRPSGLVDYLEPDGGSEQRILAVDDDPETLRYVRNALSKAGYIPLVTGDPDEVLGIVDRQVPDLVLLDLVLPGSDGIDLMQSIFEIADIPVIFLSAYGQDEVVARAFDLGASDYMVKPFSPTELAARIRAVLRRRALPESEEPSEPYVLGDLVFDFASRRASLAGHEIALRTIEYRVLAELAANAGHVVTYEQLLQRVWGQRRGSDLRPLRTVVKNLRKKLEDGVSSPRYIFTEPRTGYRMAAAR